MKTKYNHYVSRTMAHIRNVQIYAAFIVVHCSGELKLSIDECAKLMYNVARHDATKFSKEQFDAYADFTWHKKTGVPLTDNQQKAFELAWQNHYQNETHHPERLKGNAIKMSNVEVIEIVCDLQSMADEFGEGSCRSYYENIWLKNQSKNFYDDYNWFEQIQRLMDKTISCLERVK